MALTAAWTYVAIKAWRVAIWPGENPGAGAGVAEGAGGAAAAGGARAAMLRIATRRATNGEKGKPRKEKKRSLQTQRTLLRTKTAPQNTSPNN